MANQGLETLTLGMENFGQLPELTKAPGSGTQGTGKFGPNSSKGNPLKEPQPNPMHQEDAWECGDLRSPTTISIR